MTASAQTVACATCGEVHPVLSTELAYRLPDVIYDLSDELQAARAKTSPEVCMLDDSRMFVRCVLPLPVEGRPQPYRIGVWVELTQEEFQRFYALWEAPDRQSHPPAAGVLANEVYDCPGSRGLGVEVRFSEEGWRPDVLVRDDSHTLYRQQNAGISEHQAHEYSERKRATADAG